MKARLKKFTAEAEITSLINSYFAGVGIQANAAPKTAQELSAPPKKVTASRTVQKTKETKCAPPTITGLVLHLGFDKLEDFDNYEKAGKYRVHLSRARLLVACAYEKKLHTPSPSGAIYALKGMGISMEKRADTAGDTSTTMNVQIVESGPKLAANEKEVVV